MVSSMASTKYITQKYSSGKSLEELKLYNEKSSLNNKKKESIKEKQMNQRTWHIQKKIK